MEMVQRVSTVAFEGIEARAVDVQVQVAPGLPAFTIVGLPDKAVSEARVRSALIASARKIQLARYRAMGLQKIRTNAEAPAAALEDIAKPDASGLKFLRDASDTMRLSARGYHRVLRVARTLADLDGAETVGQLHIAEALSYRARAEDVRRAA